MENRNVYVNTIEFKKFERLIDQARDHFRFEIVPKFDKSEFLSYLRALFDETTVSTSESDIESSDRTSDSETEEDGRDTETISEFSPLDSEDTCSLVYINSSESEKIKSDQISSRQDWSKDMSKSNFTTISNRLNKIKVECENMKNLKTNLKEF